MFRPRTIVGIGEAFVRREPDRDIPGGLALETALVAHALGHRGVAITRLGQDAESDALVAEVEGRGLDTSHVQRDPDLATGRLVVRRLVGRTTRQLDDRAAFDNLQWDFDLEDAAQRTDAVVYGTTTMRDAQARSVVDRFVSECSSALRVLDLADPYGVDPSQTAIRHALGPAHVAAVDDAALDCCAPTVANGKIRPAVESLLRGESLDVVVYVQPGMPMALHTVDGEDAGPTMGADHARMAVITALVHGLLVGWTAAETLDLGDRVGSLIGATADADVPAEWTNAHGA